MSTPTTTRGALLRRAGTLLVAIALVGAPATSALADPTASPTTTPAADAVPSASTPATATPSPTGTPSAQPTQPQTQTPTAAPPQPSPSDPAASSSASPTSTASPSASAPSPSPSAATGTPPALATVAGAEDTAAAAFISRTLAAGGDHYVYPDSGGFLDGGNTIDGIIALSAVGTEQAQADASLAFLQSHLGDYIGSGKEVYAGPLAKTLLAVVVAGGDPKAFGGHDLIAELQALETTQGRFSDESAYGDYSNTIGQSLAVLGLARAGQGIDVGAVQQLLQRQCDDGGFAGSLATAGGCASDPDATAFAVQALLAVSSSTFCNGDAEGMAARAAAAAAAGLNLLANIQGATGGFTSADGAVNANTTGVAAQALTAGGRTSAADAAIAFIKDLQYGDSSAVALRGGIAFSADTRSTTVPTDSDLRATPQAALGLAGSSLVSVLAPGIANPAPSTTCPPAPTRAPVVAPPTSTTTPTATPTKTVHPTTSGGAHPQGAGGSDPSTTVDASATGSLAQTGSDLLAPVVLGLLLVVVGGFAIYASTRRRGAHA